MKRNYIYILFLLVTLFSACAKNEEIVFAGSQIEFDASVYNANASGATYPIVTRVPGYGRTIVTTTSSTFTADPLINRSSGTIKVRVNFVSSQSSNATTLTYRVVPDVTTAVAGTHFNTSGSFTIPANSSFGEISIDILNPGATTTGPKVLVLELIGNETIKVSENDKRLGLSIAQN
ncbi:hypothetical protein ACFQ3S_19115 [Mucilaginibacter terrae]